MKKMFRMVAVVLALCLVLTGCSGLNFAGYFQQLGAMLGGKFLTPYNQMEYTRPDMEQFQKTFEDCCSRAETEIVLPELVKIIYEFYGVYDDFYTGYALAMIGYSKDQTNTYWQEEYEFCTENSTQVDAALDRFYRILAKSPLREQLEGDAYFGDGYFDSYDGESLYDDYFQDLLRQEQELENQYYDLIAQAGEDFAYTKSFYETYGRKMAELFLELIRVRNAQATHAGYDSYPEFAYEFYYNRDYTVQQATAYLADIQAELEPLYYEAAQKNYSLGTSDEKGTFEYVEATAKQLGGTVWDAFKAMEKAQLYDISQSDDKLDASFTIYVRNYRSPYVFVNPNGTNLDKLTFAHEFGHFCKDYAAMGGGVGIDVAEIFSQGMEYLSLIYYPGYNNVHKLKMFSCLGIYLEQGAYASFEQQVYDLEELTVKNVEYLFSQTCSRFGLRGDWQYVFVTHFFTEPMYVMSYVVSNDAALQLYQMELENYGSGKQCLLDNLTSTEPNFLAFLEQAGLKSPFEQGRIQEVKETLRKVLIG